MRGNKPIVLTLSQAYLEIFNIILTLKFKN